ncbi:MAG: phosphotransferase [Paludibacteraceae bacterium]|nr:phosphotransferase [Paludibacteraceae bacterium]
MGDTDILATLCREHIGPGTWANKLIKGEGSNRKYYRLTRTPGGDSCIGVIGEDRKENEAFIYLSEHFKGKGLPVPAFIAASEDHMAYIQEDLGDTPLYNAIANGIKTGVFSAEETQHLQQAIASLPALQFEGGTDLDFGKCYPQAEMDRRAIMWDLNYFKYCFLKLQNVGFSEPQLEDDFERLAGNILRTPYHNFMVRDFQSRNVMLKDGKPYFIDYQGGRKGPFLYDVASFVWQAKANLPQNVKKQLTDTYYEALRKYVVLPRETFDHLLMEMVLFRTLQVLGAYGFRGLIEKKRHFIESIPYAIKNLKELLQTTAADDYPHLKDVLTKLSVKEELQLKDMKETDNSKLTVKVYSFSYKKGIPEDESGNGGGYVFDCRGVHNPGKYDQYKPLTGRDQAVIDFLEKDGEILKFLESVYSLADAHVARYLERGFSSLMFCFGCTGGQHRSVYSAQHTAEHIARKFGVKVDLVHREQKIEEKYNY